MSLPLHLRDKPLAETLGSRFDNDPALLAATGDIDPLDRALNTLRKGGEVHRIPYPAPDIWWRAELRKRARAGDECAAAMLAYEAELILGIHWIQEWHQDDPDAILQ